MDHTKKLTVMALSLRGCVSGADILIGKTVPAPNGGETSGLVNATLDCNASCRSGLVDQ